MTADQIIAALAALAAVLGSWLEVRRLREHREIADLRERVARLEVRCERLEVRS